MKFLDTNVILRYLTRDDERKAAACFDLFQRVKSGEEEVVITEETLAEAVYVLASRAHYQLDRDDIRRRLAPILSLRGLKLPGKGMYLGALDLYATYPFLDIGDALRVAHMERQGIGEILSYDTDFDRIPGITRLEP